MRRIITTSFVIGLALMIATPASAEDNAEFVSSQVIWDQPPRECGTDLVRFKDKWFVAYVDESEWDPAKGAVRVITSEDGVEWKSVALLESETPKRGLYRPKFTVSPDAQLMISALGVVPNPNAAEPVPKYGGTINTMAWFSADGRSWSQTERIGENDFPFSRVIWNDESAFSYANGCICGSARTIQIFSSKNGKRFQSLYEETFGDFFPDDAVLSFGDDLAYCLMSRNNGLIADSGLEHGFVGKSKAPYTEWKWLETNTRIKHPNLLRFSDKRMIATVAIADEKTRNSLCEFDPATGKLTELLEVPSSNNLMHVGLALHQGHVWVSYHAVHNGKLSVHLAQIKVD